MSDVAESSLGIWRRRDVCFPLPPSGTCVGEEEGETAVHYVTAWLGWCHAVPRRALALKTPGKMRVKGAGSRRGKLKGEGLERGVYMAVVTCRRHSGGVGGRGERGEQRREERREGKRRGGVGGERGERRSVGCC